MGSTDSLLIPRIMSRLSPDQMVLSAKIGGMGVIRKNLVIQGVECLYIAENERRKNLSGDKISELR
jgi:hypothetical protein